jgi:hypothetical protein
MKYLKPLLGVAFLLVFIYLCVQFIPPFFKNYQFQDFLDDEARKTSYTTMSEESIRTEVLREARGDSLPIKEEQIRISRGPTSVQISVEYTVHVDLPFFPQDLHFTASSANKAI